LNRGLFLASKTEIILDSDSADLMRDETGEWSDLSISFSATGRMTLHITSAEIGTFVEE
jgi:hypothetical protein